MAYTFCSVVYLIDGVTQLLGINDADQMVGDHGAATVAGSTFILPANAASPVGFVALAYPGAAQTQVQGLNATGAEAGSYVDSAGATHGFIATAGTYTSVDLAGTAATALLALNNQGQDVGVVTPSGGGPRRVHRGAPAERHVRCGATSRQSRQRRDRDRRCRRHRRFPPTERGECGRLPPAGRRRGANAERTWRDLDEGARRERGLGRRHRDAGRLRFDRQQRVLRGVRKRPHQCRLRARHHRRRPGREHQLRADRRRSVRVGQRLGGWRRVGRALHAGRDHIALHGYGDAAVQTALQSAVSQNGPTQIVLPDGTQVLFLGVASLATASFV